MTAPREHHLGYAVVMVTDTGELMPVLTPIRMKKTKATRDLTDARAKWPKDHLRVVRVSGFLAGPRAPR